MKKERKPLEIPLKILWLVRWFFEIVINYSIVMSVSVYMLPMLLITLGRYIGVTYDTEIVDILVLFALPSLFLVAICVIVYFFVMKLIHKVFNKIYNKATVKYREVNHKSADEKIKKKSKGCKKLDTENK